MSGEINSENCYGMGFLNAQSIQIKILPKCSTAATVISLIGCQTDHLEQIKMAKIGTCDRF